MATVNKNFKIKQGLVVEGTTATVNSYDVLTKKQADQDYIVSLIGGTSTSQNTPDTVVKRDGSGDFAAGTITANLVGDVTGNADTATTLETARTISLAGDVTGSVSFDGSQNVSITATIDGSFATNDEVAIALEDYTPSNSLDATIGGYGYLKSEDIAGKQNTLTAGTGITILNDTVSVTSNTYDAYGDADAVQSNLNDHASDTATHGVGEIVGTTESQTISNKTLGSDLAAGGYKVSGLATPTNNADAATKSYVDTAVAGLVDSAPALLDTLNELAAAIGDDENFITTVTTSIGEKVAKAGDSMTGDLDFGGTNKVTSLAAPTSNGDAANKLYVDTEVSNAISTTTYTAGTNIDITGNVVSVTGLDTDDVSEGTNLYFTNQRALDATSAAYDIAGAASTAQSNAETFATNAINALNTDDILEAAGASNLYFTDARAKTSATDLLVNSNQTNIVITEAAGGGLIITAENGVADSTTADLAEDPNATVTSGTMYFTDQRALDAVSGSTISPDIVEITWARKEKAAYTYIATASTNNVFTWNRNEGASAKFLVRVKAGTHSQISEVLTTVDDSNNIAITEYGTVGTNGNLGNISATYDENTMLFALTVETTENNSEVFVAATLLSYAD